MRLWEILRPENVGYKIWPCLLFRVPAFSLLNFTMTLTDINGNPIDEALKRDGYVIVDGLIPDDMFDKLKAACDRVVDRARKGEWKYR